MKKIRYSLIGAYNDGINMHPQKYVESLGMKVLSFEGIPIADCAIMVVDEVPYNLPEWIEIIK